MMVSWTHKKVLLLAAVSAFALLVSCSSASKTYVGEGAQVVPNESVQDLVTYGDIAVIFTVVSEKELPPDEDQASRGEGWISRQVNVRQNGNVLWQRPSRSTENTGSGPSDWTIGNGGWVFHGTRRDPLRSSGVPYLQVNQQYLAVRVQSSKGEGTPTEWFSLIYLPLINGRVSLSAGLIEGEPPPVFAVFDNLTVEGVIGKLRSTEPDPAAVPYMNLDASARHRKVVVNS